jgi:hypothetical protein
MRCFGITLADTMRRVWEEWNEEMSGATSPRVSKEWLKERARPGRESLYWPPKP